VYCQRLENLPLTVSAFSAHLVLQRKKIPYIAANQYYHEGEAQLWSSADYNAEQWPQMYMLSMTADKEFPQYADTITVLSYMRFNEVETWANSSNTIVSPKSRGAAYKAFKEAKIAALVDKVAVRFPQLKDSIVYSYASSPLSYRDYIGTSSGSMYGPLKDVENPLLSHISISTKIPNLFLVGQNIGMHGVLGVTIGAVAVCGKIVSLATLIDKVKAANDD